MKIIQLVITIAIAEFSILISYFLFSDLILNLLTMFIPKGLPISLLNTIMQAWSVAMIGLGVIVLVYGIWYATKLEYDQYYKY